MLREESCLIPLNSSDVVRRPQTHLDILQERNIDDKWNVDGETPLSGSWCGFTRFTVLKKPSPDGHLWARERLTNIQTTSRPDNIWPEVWSKMSKTSASMQNNRSKTVNDKPSRNGKEKNHKLDAARRVRGICYMAPYDQELDTVIKHTKKKLCNAFGIRHAQRNSEHKTLNNFMSTRPGEPCAEA